MVTERKLVAPSTAPAILGFMKFALISSILFFILGVSGSLSARMTMKAVIKEPVVDVVGQSLRPLCSDVMAVFLSFPVAPDKGSSACLRLHQLLFNQEVTIVKELLNGEVHVEVTDLFYLDGLHRKRNDFWMLKKDLILLSSLSKEAGEAVPCATTKDEQLAVSVPWYCDETKRTYSVGTRFVRYPENDTESSYGILMVDPMTKKILKILIPQDKAAIPEKSFIKARQIFLSLLRGWAHHAEGFIPYIYGGCSFVKPITEQGFLRISGVQCGQKATYWERTGYTDIPKSGFDCSSMILRAAQIAGLPYEYKNTLALVSDLRPLKLGDVLEEGDLIWYSGHVMILSDVKKNLIIEAIGYEAGYGKVHEIPISKVFSGIKNCEELKQAHFTKHLTYRLNSSGTPWRSVYRVKILKLTTG